MSCDGSCDSDTALQILLEGLAHLGKTKPHLYDEVLRAFGQRVILEIFQRTGRLPS